MSNANQQLTYSDRYVNTQSLDYVQANPKDMKVKNFKQDYTVIIRKKLYYAITQDNNENYIKVFQLNNFTSLQTSITVYHQGSATVTLKGGEKVIVANKDSEIAKNNIPNFATLLDEWNSIDDDRYDTFKGVDFNTADRQDKFTWAMAEKCDIEPMDEIYIFGKSRREKTSKGDYKFKQIFFGYISTVTKSYGAGQTGPQISIQAQDHLKLLSISRVANRPALDMRTDIPAARLDGHGMWVIEDDYLYQGIDPNTLQPTSSAPGMVYTNAFAGKSGTDIIKELCIESGIPEAKLSSRIEQTDRVPFAIQLRGNFGDLFSGDFTTRDQYCYQAADKLNFEFFADEEGNIVWKIPSYNLGINRLPANNMGSDLTYLYDVGGALHQTSGGLKTTTQTVTKTRTVTKNVTQNVYHTVVKGDKLWTLAGTYLGNPMRWPEIYNLNKSQISDPHWIYPGQVFLISVGKTIQVQEPYTEQVQVTTQVNTVLNNNSISAITDNMIPVIYPWEIVSFTFQDSDQEVYTAAQVTAETPFINLVSTGATDGAVRAVMDPILIQQFGVRVAPPVTTPLVGGSKGAELYANMLIIRSISNRYSGQLQVIDDPSIKVGDPVRFHLYDENPFPELYKGDPDNQNADINAQAIFYVDGISRSVSMGGGTPSMMSLSLRAGRMMGMPSIFDKCVNLYRPFYEDTVMPPAPEDAGNPTGTVVGNGQKYTIQKGDSLWKIACKFYGSGNGVLWKKIYDANRKDLGVGPLTSPNRIYAGQIITIPPQ